jgi:PAS domain-containing protein
MTLRRSSGSRLRTASAKTRPERFPSRRSPPAARTGRFESEGWRVRADGTRFWALGVINAVRDHDGKLIGFAKVIRDMTEWRLEQSRLLESERRFRDLVDSVVD